MSAERPALKFARRGFGFATGTLNGSGNREDFFHCADQKVLLNRLGNVTIHSSFQTALAVPD